MRNTATNLTAVSIRSASKTRAADQLPHDGSSFGKVGPETDDEEEQIIPREDRLLEAPVRLPGDPLLPVPSDRSPASPSHDHRESRGRAPVALVQELHSPRLDPARRGEHSLDVPASAESFPSSKASSHQRL